MISLARSLRCPAKPAGGTSRCNGELCDARKPLQYIWSVNVRSQIYVIVETGLVFPLWMVPLELQRRIVDDAIRQTDFDLLTLPDGSYLALMLVQGGLKLLMNIQCARVIQSTKSLPRYWRLFVDAFPQLPKDTPPPPEPRLSLERDPAGRWTECFLDSGSLGANMPGCSAECPHRNVSSFSAEESKPFGSSQRRGR
jgi:hypothetical protein